MRLLERLKLDAAALKAQRDTAAGRRFELRMISADCNILLLGCVGLAIWFPPLIYAAAIGHLIVGFMLSPAKSIWLVLTLITVVVTSVFVFVGTYLVQHYYFGVLEHVVANQLRTDWLLYAAIGIVVGGVIMILFAHPGGVGQLIEYKDRAESSAQE